MNNIEDDFLKDQEVPDYEEFKAKLEYHLVLERSRLICQESKMSFGNSSKSKTTSSGSPMDISSSTSMRKNTVVKRCNIGM